MRDFKHFGVKRRFFPDRNYNAIWCNLKTIRLGEGKALELPSVKNHTDGKTIRKIIVVPNKIVNIVAN